MSKIKIRCTNEQKKELIQLFGAWYDCPSFCEYQGCKTLSDIELDGLRCEDQIEKSIDWEITDEQEKM